MAPFVAPIRSRPNACPSACCAAPWASSSWPASTGRPSRPELRSLAREFDLGGVVLFKRNVEEPAQVAELAFESAHAAAERRPPWVGVDQEGGRVARLRRAVHRVAADGRARPRRADEADAGARASRARSPRELAAVGITLDFAPVLDVLTNPANPAIGDRALRGRPGARGGARARASSRRCRARGIAACGKHFPGHGDTAVDSHHELPVVEHPPDRLRGGRVRAVPRGHRGRTSPSIMTAHVLVPALDEHVPGHALAPRSSPGCCASELDFDGLIFTDDLDMKAHRRPLRRCGETAVRAHRGRVRRRS